MAWLPKDTFNAYIKTASKVSLVEVAVDEVTKKPTVAGDRTRYAYLLLVKTLASGLSEKLHAISALEYEGTQFILHQSTGRFRLHFHEVSL